MRTPPTWLYRTAACLILRTLVLAAAAVAASRPGLTLAAHASRTRTSGVGPLPVYDTKWWIDVHAPRGDVPLTRIESQARFSDASGVRPLGGSWQLSDGDANGRVLVTCTSPTDYDRHLRVQLRVRDSTGAVSDWTEVEFPPPTESQSPVTRRDDTLPVSATTRSERRHEQLGTVEVDATDAMSIGEVKAALQKLAHAKGGDAVLGLRLVRSTPDHVIFAADVIRYLDVPVAVTPTPVPAPSDRVLGEIVVPAARR